jgi:hypothetical protein
MNGMKDGFDIAAFSASHPKRGILGYNAMGVAC